MAKAPVVTVVSVIIVVALLMGCGTAQPGVDGPTPAPTPTLLPLNPPPIIPGRARTLPAPAPEPPGVLEGREIFQGRGACATCHTVGGLSENLLGPELTTIGTTAASRRPGYSAQQYIIESIRQPDAYVVEGYPRDLMTEALTRHLTDDEVAALAEFLQYQQ